MELSLRAKHPLVPSQQDNPTNIYLHHHHQQQKFHNSKDSGLSKTESCFRSGFVQKKQCRSPEDADLINVIRDEASFLKFKSCSKSMGRKQGLLWTKHRDQASMNQYEVNTSSKSKSVTNVVENAEQFDWHNADPINPEYSYAYCEPIIKKVDESHHTTIPGRLLSIPTSVSNNELCKTHKPGNSLRALLSKSFRKSSISHPDERHTFTTQYGKKENIYEDLDNVLMPDGAKSKHRLSRESIGNVLQSEEQKFVEFQHNRVMNELNLSIEELLMPSQSETDHIDYQELLNKSEAYQQEENQLKFDGFKRPDPPYRTQIQFNPSLDMDSGFSGSSSSGASYAGSMRYRSSMINFTNKSVSSKTVIPETPGMLHDQSEENVSSFHLVKNDNTHLDCILPYAEQCSSYCLHSNERHNFENTKTTSLHQLENRIETISEKVNLRNKLSTKSKDVFNSTKCSYSKKNP